MNRPRILVVYFSRSGYTRTLARRIAELSGGDLEEIQEPHGRRGWRGYVRSLVEAVTGQATAIAPGDRRPADYDLVVVGTPVWASSVSSPVRAYLLEHRGQLRQVAFFLTQGGHEHRRVFRQMETAALRAPVAALAMRDGELDAGLEEPVLRFVDDLARIPGGHALSAAPGALAAAGAT
jgi:flavodoxin